MAGLIILRKGKSVLIRVICGKKRILCLPCVARRAKRGGKTKKPHLGTGLSITIRYTLFFSPQYSACPA